MLGALAEAIEGLDAAVIGADPGLLADTFAVYDLLRARMTDAVGHFDTDGLWACDNATSATAWLRAFARLAGSNASGWVAIARRLRRLPSTAAAFTDGRLSHDQVRAALACVDDDLIDLYLEREDDLLAALAPLSVNDVTIVMRSRRM